MQSLQYYLRLNNKNDNIFYDLLDPSPDAVLMARHKLKSPFQLGQEYVTTIQEAKLEDNVYDLLWSMHGLYTIPCQDLPYVLTQCTNCMKTTGVGFIALATRKSFYIDFYHQYLNSLCEGKGARFTSAEDIVDSLLKCGIRHSVKKIIYEEKIPIDCHAELEHYIKVESTINSFNKNLLTEEVSSANKISFEGLISNPGMQLYFKTLIRNSCYYFPQEIWLISFYR